MKPDPRVLVDTSAWIDALRKDGDPSIREAVRTVVADDRAAFCDMVRLELWAGARGAAERRLLHDLERDVENLPTTPEVWASARRLARQARKNGITIPATDLLVAACARHHAADLLHNDHHFELLAKTTEPDAGAAE